MKVVLDSGATMPTRANDDAGFDLYSREEKYIPALGSAIFDTGVHVQIPKDYCGVLISKSGLNTKRGLTSTGLIDSGYTGSIAVKLYNQSPKAALIAKGEKISQLVIMPIITPDLEQADSLEDTARGDNGFGSTGRF